MRHNQKTFIFSLFAAASLVYGCSSNQRIENTQVPQQAPSNEPVVTSQPAVQPAPSSHYSVEPHDTLWGIAGKTDIYADSFQWPLIFKANRDTIKDPDLIYPHQDFVIQKDASADEVAQARKLAMETPKYVPHTQPRQTLPLDYF